MVDKVQLLRSPTGRRHVGPEFQEFPRPVVSVPMGQFLLQQQAAAQAMEELLADLPPGAVRVGLEEIDCTGVSKTDWSEYEMRIMAWSSRQGGG